MFLEQMSPILRRVASHHRRRKTIFSESLSGEDGGAGQRGGPVDRPVDEREGRGEEVADEVVGTIWGNGGL